MNNYIILDIETGLNSGYEKFLIPPKLKKDGEPYANSKTIEQQKEEGALSALTGRTILIGVKDYEGNETILNCDSDEANRLTGFWALLSDQIKRRNNIVGFNIKAFDLPFLIQRSWILGVKPCKLLNGRYWSDLIIDIAEQWTCFAYGKKPSLNNVAMALNVGSKVTDDSKHFEDLWNTDKEKAIAHLKNDLFLTDEIYKRIYVDYRV